MEFLIADDKKDTLTSVGLLLLRLWAGLAMFFGHGLGKLTDFAGTAEQFDGMLGLPGPVAATLAIAAEGVCSLLIAAGALTRLLAIPLVINMCVATYAHVALWGDSFAGYELALMYGVVFLTFVFTGPGRFSVDNIIENARK